MEDVKPMFSIKIASSKRLLTAALILAASLSMFSCIDQELVDSIEHIQIDRAMDFTTLRDGSYEALVDKQIVSARVRVTVRAGRVDSIEILKHGHGPGKKHGAYELPARVVAAQSLDVDWVSGATGSSKVMLKAIEEALRAGL